MNELVSVIIPTYKRPDTLKRSIESVLNQTHKNIEIIVVDDNGVGTEYGILTEEVMSEYADNNYVKYIQHKTNVNGSAARNTGFRASHGEYIMFLDDDDEFLPEKISSQLAVLASKDDSWGACYSKHIRVSPSGEKLVSYGTESKEGDLLIEELKRNLFISAGSNLMVKRHVVEEVGGFNENFLRNQDVEFLVKILKNYKLAYSKTLGLKVHVHPKPKRKETFEQITEKFVQTFKEDIEALGEKSSEVYRMINLQIFRSLITNKSTRKNSFKMIKDKRVSVLDAIRYFIHLFFRKVFKISCGFKL